MENKEEQEEIKKGYTRVTTIVGLLSDFSKIDPEVLKRKTRLGSNVHTAIDKFLEDEIFPLNEKESAYFDSFLHFTKSDEWKDLKITKKEDRLYSEEYKITGKFDIAGTIEDKNVLIDWKTTAMAHKKNWALQAGFYSILLKESFDIDIDTAYFVQLKNTGSYSVHRFDMSKGKFQKVCLHLLSVFRYLHPLL